MEDTTAIIVVTDNPPHIWESIQSVNKFVKEIIVGTVRINHDLYIKLKSNPKIRLVNLPADTPFADMVKEDLKKLVRTKYLLYLDPDEIFPKDVFKIIEKKINEFNFFSFPRKNIIFKKWIKHSRWWPDYQLRFFQKDMVVWPKKIHPDAITHGLGYMFPAEERFAIQHYNYDDIDQYFKKANRYAKSEAYTYIENNVVLTLPETVKKSISEFISRFFACEGYKDGIHGYILGVLQTFYYFMVYMYYWEVKKYEKVDEETIIKSARDFFKSGASETGFWVIQKELASKVEQVKIKIVTKLLKEFKL